MEVNHEQMNEVVSVLPTERFEADYAKYGFRVAYVLHQYAKQKRDLGLISKPSLDDIVRKVIVSDERIQDLIMSITYASEDGNQRFDFDEDEEYGVIESIFHLARIHISFDLFIGEYEPRKEIKPYCYENARMSFFQTRNKNQLPDYVKAWRKIIAFKQTILREYWLDQYLMREIIEGVMKPDEHLKIAQHATSDAEATSEIDDSDYEAEVYVEEDF